MAFVLDMWLHFDDTSVYFVPTEEVENTEAYILIYQKQILSSRIVTDSKLLLQNSLTSSPVANTSQMSRDTEDSCLKMSMSVKSLKNEKTQCSLRGQRRSEDEDRRASKKAKIQKQKMTQRKRTRRQKPSSGDESEDQCENGSGSGSEAENESELSMPNAETMPKDKASVSGNEIGSSTQDSSTSNTPTESEPAKVQNVERRVTRSMAVQFRESQTKKIK